MKLIISDGQKALFASRVAVAWTVVMLATDLRDYIPHVHWMVTVVSVALITPYLVEVRRDLRRPAVLAAVLLVIAVCLPAFYAGNALYSFAEAGKLAFILIGGMLVLATRTHLSRHAFTGLVIAVYLNFILIIGGLLGLKSAELMGAARWGTILSVPGSLWRVAIGVWVYSAYLILKTRARNAAFLFCASTTLIILDGARTAFLILLVGLLYLVHITAFEAGRFRKAAFLLVGVFSLIALLFTVIQSIDPSSGGFFGRVAELANSLQQQGFAGLEVADVTRYQMLQDAGDAIKAHPFLGTGIGTTTTNTFVGPIPIHMTYLQVWADLGLLGFIACTWVMWGWLLWLPRAMRHIRSLADSKQKALYYNAVFLLMFYGLSGFLHPISTEWSEWVTFIIPYGLVWQIASASGVVVLEGAAQGVRAAPLHASWSAAVSAS